MHNNINIVDCSNPAFCNGFLLRYYTFDFQVSIYVQKEHIKVNSSINIFSILSDYTCQVLVDDADRDKNIVVCDKNGSIFMNSAGALYQVQKVRRNRVTALRVDFDTKISASNTVQLTRNEYAVYFINNESINIISNI